MLKVAIIDSNTKATFEESFIDSVVSVVGHWLKWECDQVEFPLTTPDKADICFLVHSGQVDWLSSCRKHLKRWGIEPLSALRNRAPYVIAGGPVDATPFTALTLADGLAIGEAYLFVRQIIDIAKSAQDVAEVAEFIISYPYALERSQIAALRRDTNNPWLLCEVPTPLAAPDDYVDWDANVMIRTDDKVIRVIASKGCHLKCKFCATTYRQSYRVNPSAEQILTAMDVASNRHESIALITNDAAALPFFDAVTRKGQLSFQSLTVKALRDPAIVDAVIRSRLKMARFGVEGISERIRQAFGKPIPDDELIELLGKLSDNGIDTHIFFIVGSPYEDETDWEAYKRWHIALAKRIGKRTCRIKLTAFNPQPPTPLAYLVPNSDYYEYTKQFMTWLLANWKSRHVTFITPRKPETRIQDLADSFALDKDEVKHLMQGDRTVDLAPAVEYAERMPWEVINWPLPAKTRWHLSRSYMKYMDAMPRASERAG